MKNFNVITICSLSLSPQFSMLAVPSVIISPVCCQSMQGDVYCPGANVLSRHLFILPYSLKQRMGFCRFPDDKLLVIVAL